MAGSTREQTLSLLSTAKNHGDLAVKLSSLKQVKEILVSVDPSFAAELLPYVIELHMSPESLVRRFVVELMEEIGVKVMEQSSLFVPVLLTLLKDDVSFVVRQTIVSSTNFFCSVLKQMALQFRQCGKVERSCEELWMWMIKLKDAIHGIALTPGSIGTRLLAIKFLEIHILLVTPDVNDSESSNKAGNGRTFDKSWVADGHPILDAALLTLEAKRSLNLLLDTLQSANILCGSLIIAVVNCLAAIARKRPLHYSIILSLLLGFDPNLETPKGGHTASIQYSLRTAFLGFLRCTHPVIIESREKLIRALRTMNAGDAADQVIRKVDKLLKNADRASRDVRLNKEDPPSSVDLTRKRSMLQDEGEPNNIDEVPSKRPRYQIPCDSGQDDLTSNGFSSSKVSPLDNDLTPVEQMIAMIGALLAEGERGANSLEVLISNIHPDLMADIVIANMKHLPKSVPLASRLGSIPPMSLPTTSSSSINAAPTMATSFAPATTLQLPDSTSQVVSPIYFNFKMETSTDPLPNLPQDSKRDPRRDPRRLDPRRVPTPAEVQSLPGKDDDGDMQSGFDGSIGLSSPSLSIRSKKVEEVSTPLTLKKETEISECLVQLSTDQLDLKENLEDVEEGTEIVPVIEVKSTSDIALSSVHGVDQDPMASTISDIIETFDVSYMSDSDQRSPVSLSTSAPEEISYDLPLPPIYIELTEEQQNTVRKLAVTRIFDSCKKIQATGYTQTRMALLARLVAQIDDDGDIAVMLEKHTLSTYESQKGHELAMYVLYYLHAAAISGLDDLSSSVADTYEKFLVAVAKSLRDKLPASDKSFSRFLGEVPLLPDSALTLLEHLCYSEGFDNGKGTRDSDRITQGLGAVWSLILARPLYREACLNIALKCAVHMQEDVRAKAIRLVANKLYPLNYLSERIERFATKILMSVVDQQVPEAELLQVGSTEQTEGNETSISGSQNSEPGTSEDEYTKGVQHSVPAVSLSQAQRCMSLFFALCTKNPSLLQLVFDTYGRAPKTIKQAVHRHIPILVKNMGSSYSDLLYIISNPPLGSENLLLLVLQILTEETTPSADLIATVKHLYETKLKDAAILIPMLSLLPKDEVLPIFPRLVDLPLEKFQIALARILQGSAHTGPALTPAEVLVAIHVISPENDRIALKKVMEACSACFEQRTVFTEQVLAKALNQLVDHTPLPLIFMRTVIQAIDAYPSMVDFVMDILSKLVSKQIWKMPKLWVGFLKCMSQTQPHSFRVLLKLPPPQLEIALNKHNNLRSPLAAYASQTSIRSSLPRSILVVLGFTHESHMQQRPVLPNSLHTSDTSSSVHGAMLT